MSSAASELIESLTFLLVGRRPTKEEVYESAVRLDKFASSLISSSQIPGAGQNSFSAQIPTNNQFASAVPSGGFNPQQTFQPFPNVSQAKSTSSKSTQGHLSPESFNQAISAGQVICSHKFERGNNKGTYCGCAVANVISSVGNDHQLCKKHSKGATTNGIDNSAVMFNNFGQGNINTSGGFPANNLAFSGKSTLGTSLGGPLIPNQQAQPNQFGQQPINQFGQQPAQLTQPTQQNQFGQQPTQPINQFGQPQAQFGQQPTQPNQFGQPTQLTQPNQFNSNNILSFELLKVPPQQMPVDHQLTPTQFNPGFQPNDTQATQFTQFSQFEQTAPFSQSLPVASPKLEDFLFCRSFKDQPIYFSTITGSTRLVLMKSSDGILKCQGRVDIIVENKSDPLPDSFESLINYKFTNEENTWLLSNGISKNEDSKSENNDSV